MTEMKGTRGPQETGTDAGEQGHGAPAEAASTRDLVRQAGDRAFGPPPPGAQWPGRETSKQERTGVPPTDTAARSPLGVGTSTSRRPEKMALKDREAGPAQGTRGRSGRPTRKARPEHDTGVAAQGPIDEESPHLPVGDQAG
jgi:hypothetical protein